MHKYHDCVVTLSTVVPVRTSHIPTAADIAQGLVAGNIATADQLVTSRISDLFAAGFCAKPICFDDLFSPDPAQRTALKQLKAASCIELSLLRSVCTEEGRFLMGAQTAENALLQLLESGSACNRQGYLQTGTKPIPITRTIDPQRESPLISVLDGSFCFYLYTCTTVVDQLKETSGLTLGQWEFCIDSVQPISFPEAPLQCLQAAASVTAKTHLADPASRFRLIYQEKNKVQYVTCGSLIAPGDYPGNISFRSNQQPCTVLPYTFSVYL